MAIPPLVLRIYADSSGVRAGVAQTQRQVGGLKQSISQNSALIKTAIVGGVVFGLKASVDAAREAATAQLKLQNSIANSAVVSAGAGKAFTEQANALRDLTGVDDEAIIGAQSFLVQMGLTEDQIKSLTPLIVDLSVKMGIDLTTAAKAVGKSVNGTTGGLMKMGVIVDTTKAKTDAYGATLDALGVAQGFAAKQAKLEPWKQLGAQFEELLEVVGEAILPTLRSLTNVLRVILPVVRRLGPYLVAAATGLALWWTVGKIGALAGAISSTSTAMTALGVASLSAAGPLGIIAGLIAGVVVLESSSSSALERQTAALVLLGFSAKEAGQMIEDEFSASLKKVPGDLRTANMAVYDMVQAQERGAEVAQGWAMRQAAVADAAKKAGQAIKRFAGMTATELKTWGAEVRERVGGVKAVLDELAEKAHLTADKVIRAFQRQIRAQLEFEENFKAVARRGVPEEILLQITDMADGGAAMLDLLAHTSKAKFDKIIAQFERVGDTAPKVNVWIQSIIDQLNSIPTNIGITIGGVGGDFSNPKFKAIGGPVSAGMPYIVGEHGPEWFIPNTSGKILPNGQNPAAPMGDITIPVYLGDEILERVVVKGLDRARRRT
jgi:hypothetical protein